jgi:hypothetical protein
VRDAVDEEEVLEGNVEEKTRVAGEENGGRDVAEEEAWVVVDERVPGVVPPAALLLYKPQQVKI